MTDADEKPFDWALKPVERRIAEAAFAAGGSHMAITRVLELRGLFELISRKHYYDRPGWYEGMRLAISGDGT